MPSQNGRNTTRGDDGRRRWQPHDVRDRDPDRGDEGYRPTDRYGGGQSGYGSGRMGDDRSMGPGYRNQAPWSHRYDDRQGIHTDDRFTGRGGPSYWEDRDVREYEDYHPERSGVPGGYGGGRGFEDRHGSAYNSGYNRGGTGFGGYDQQGIQRQIGSHQAFRGGPDHDDELHEMYGPREGNLGHPGGGEYGQRYPRSMRGGDLGGARGMPPLPERGAGGHAAPIGQHRGKGPLGYTRSDERIKETVCEALTDDDQIDATHVEVVVKNGEVLLTGTVEDRRMKRLAEDVIERLPGVRDVQNQLRVRGNPEPGRQVGTEETETSRQPSEKKYRA